MYGWHYVCSLCKAKIEVDNVTSHMQWHQGQPDWPGTMEFTREDKDEHDDQ